MWLMGGIAEFETPHISKRAAHPPTFQAQKRRVPRLYQSNVSRISKPLPGLEREHLYLMEDRSQCPVEQIEVHGHYH